MPLFKVHQGDLLILGLFPRQWSPPWSLVTRSCNIAWLPKKGKRTPTSVRKRSSRVDFRLRNPSSPDVVFVMKALFSILDPQNRAETNTCFVFAHDFVLASRYLHFFPLLTYITDSKKLLRCLLFTDGRLQLQHNDTSTKSVKTEKNWFSFLFIKIIVEVKYIYVVIFIYVEVS